MGVPEKVSDSLLMRPFKINERPFTVNTTPIIVGSIPISQTNHGLGIGIILGLRQK